MSDDAEATAPAQRADEGRMRWAFVVVAVLGLMARATAFSRNPASPRNGLRSSAFAERFD